MVRGEGSEPAAALLPNNVSSERETPCPLSSPVMKERLLAAKQRTEGIPVAGRTGPRTGAPRDAVDPGRSNASHLAGSRPAGASQARAFRMPVEANQSTASYCLSSAAVEDPDSSLPLLRSASRPRHERRGLDTPSAIGLHVLEAAMRAPVVAGGLEFGGRSRDEVPPH